MYIGPNFDFVKKLTKYYFSNIFQQVGENG